MESGITPSKEFWVQNTRALSEGSIRQRVHFILYDTAQHFRVEDVRREVLAVLEDRVMKDRVAMNKQASQRMSPQGQSIPPFIGGPVIGPSAPQTPQRPKKKP